MSRTAPRGVPSWQTDDSADECFLCHKNFSLFFRRHHCRKCGRVVCGNCSQAKSTYLPTAYVVSPPSQIFLESPHVPHRTCDECMLELDMIRTALRAPYGESTSGRSSRRRMSDIRSNTDGRGSGRRSRRATYSSSSSTSATDIALAKAFDESETLIQSVAIDADEDDRCPVCGRALANVKEADRETHINDCLVKASENNNRRNRMIIYKLPSEESVNLGECVICFEDLEPGETVGRLECLCVYHEKCILDWFSRKGAGSCPVHNQHS